MRESLRQPRAFTVLVRLAYEPDLKRWWKLRLTVDRGVSGYYRQKKKRRAL